MTRAEADALVAEYDDAASEHRVARRLMSFARMNACRERILDRLCGEEATQPLAGNERSAT